MPPITRYPLDPTGVSPDNLVQGELCTLVNRHVRSIAPMYGAYYAESMVITDLATGLPLNATQWFPGELYDLPTAKYGKAVYAIILITDVNVSENVSIRYQAVGGEYSICDTAILQLIAAIDTGNRPVAWPDIVRKPAQYPPSQHLHDAGDLFGFEYIVHALDRLREAVQFGDIVSHDQLLSYFDTTLTNTLQTRFGNVDNTHDMVKPVSAAQDAANQLILSYAKTYTDAKTALINPLSIGLGNVDNTSDANKPVSIAQAAADATVLSTAKSYADGLVVGLWDDRGSFNASINTFPTTGGSGVAGAVLKGDIWTISTVATAGPLLGIPSGSTVRAVVNAPAQLAASWSVAEVGLGYNVVQQGTGVSQGANAVKIGWGVGAYASKLAVTVDSTDFGNTWPININGNSAYATNAGNITAYTINQNLGTGNSPTFNNLTLNGSLTIAGEITSFYSDDRLKERTGVITNALDKVCSLDTFTYRANALANSFGFTTVNEQVGLSAQQLQIVLPQAVSLAPFDLDLHEDGSQTSKTGENFLTAKYERAVPLLVASTKELRDIVESTKAENNALKNEVAELRRMLEEFMGRK